MTTTVELGSLVLAGAPICYGILMPGADTPGGIPVVKVRDYDHRGIEVEKLLRVAPNVEAPFRRSRLEPGDILMSIRGTTGALAAVPRTLEGANSTQDTARIRVQQEERDFLYQALQAPFVQRQIELHTIGQAVRGINIASVRKLQIPWPNLGVRNFVARAMGTCDAQIRLLAQLVSAKRTFKRGLQQELLVGHQRFPEFAQGPWVNTEIGELLEEATRPVKWDDEDFYTLVSVRRRSGGVFFREKKRGADIKVKALFEILSGDILISTRQVVHGAVARVPAEFNGAHVSGEYMVLVPRKGAKILPEYFEQLSMLPRMYHVAFLASYGVDVEKLTFNSDWYLSSIVRVPPTIEEQRRIANTLSAVDREIELLEAQRQLMEAYKRGLLSRLLSGEIAVPA